MAAIKPTTAPATIMRPCCFSFDIKFLLLPLHATQCVILLVYYSRPFRRMEIQNNDINMVVRY